MAKPGTYVRSVDVFRIRYTKKIIICKNYLGLSSIRNFLSGSLKTSYSGL